MKIAFINSSPDLIDRCISAIAHLNGLEHVWSARTCEEALKKASLSQPNIIIIGLDLAAMCVKKLMKDFPCAIIVATVDGANRPSQVFEAMGDGALDVVTLELDDTGIPKQLIEKICMIRLLLASGDDEPFYTFSPATFALTPELVVIGCSTGGPSALMKILQSMNNRMEVAMVVIQHVDEKFAPGLAEWLARHTSIPVCIAQHGSVPQRGTVLISSAQDHLVMTRNCRVRYTPYPIEKPYRPSVDVFFESLAHFWPGKGTAILLTGMGTDGAIGLKMLRDAGWHTIVEHEASCVVYGMPKAAIELNAAVEILKLEDIAQSIVNRIGK